jgi:glycosyltransferase involved in cell wall biosynthesis
MFVSGRSCIVISARPHGESLKILLVGHYILPHTGGIEVVLDQLGRTFARQGHSVTVVASGPVSSEDNQGGVRRVQVAAWNGLERALHVPYPVFSPSIVPTIWREAENADVVHVHGLLYVSSIVGLLAALVRGRPLVVTEHVGFVAYRSPLLNAAQIAALVAARWLFRLCANAAIVYRKGVAAWLEAGGAWSEIAVPGQCVDTTRFRPPSPDDKARARTRFGLPQNAILVLYSGRIVAKKRVDLLLAAADPTYEIVLCGPGEVPSGTAAISLAQVRHDDMPHVYRAADVFCLPSRGEGFPVALCEAMASGLACVVTADAVEAGPASDGLVFADADPASLREALRRLARNAADRTMRGAAARELALTHFDVEAAADAHVRLYERACRRAADRRELRRARFRSLHASVLALVGTAVTLLGVNPGGVGPWLERDGFRIGLHAWALSFSHEDDPFTHYGLAPERDVLLLSDARSIRAGPSGRSPGALPTEVGDAVNGILIGVGAPRLVFEARDRARVARYEWVAAAKGFELHAQVRGTPATVRAWRHQLSVGAHDEVFTDAAERLQTRGSSIALGASDPGPGRWVAVWNPSTRAAWRLRLQTGDRVEMVEGALWLERAQPLPSAAPRDMLRFETIPRTKDDRR